jgi:hypothetical protein
MSIQCAYKAGFMQINRHIMIADFGSLRAFFLANNRQVWYHAVLIEAYGGRYGIF